MVVDEPERGLPFCSVRILEVAYRTKRSCVDFRRNKRNSVLSLCRDEVDKFMKPWAFPLNDFVSRKGLQAGAMEREDEWSTKQASFRQQQSVVVLAGSVDSNQVSNLWA